MKVINKCNKESYETYGQAESILKVIRTRHNSSSKSHQRPIKVYKCKRCGEYHLTGTKRG